MPYPEVGEKGLACIRVRLIAKKGGREGEKGEIETQETASLPQLLLLRRKKQKKYISACLLI